MKKGVKFPVAIAIVTDNEGKCHTAIVDADKRVCCELTFADDYDAMVAIVDKANGTGKGGDTSKQVADACEELTQAAWRDATAPTDADACATRRAAFRDFSDGLSKLLQAYWKATYVTR